MNMMLTSACMRASDSGRPDASRRRSRCPAMVTSSSAGGPLAFTCSRVHASPCLCMLMRQPLWQLQQTACAVRKARGVGSTSSQRSLVMAWNFLRSALALRTSCKTTGRCEACCPEQHARCASHQGGKVAYRVEDHVRPQGVGEAPGRLLQGCACRNGMSRRLPKEGHVRTPMERGARGRRMERVHT